jgi:hypothetical protein
MKGSPGRNASTPRRRPSSYTIERVFKDGAYHHFVDTQCSKCGKDSHFTCPNEEHPGRIAHHFHDLGWDFDPYKPRSCICPTCKGTKKETNTPAQVASVTTVEEKPMATITPLTMVTTAPRPLTNAEKAGVRRLLDTQFDDEAGRYIEGYSDQRIGQELEVPWSAVAAMREAAYGPLRADPRIDRLEQTLLDLKTRVSGAVAQMEKAQTDLNHRIQEAEKVLAAIKGGG